MISRLRSKEFIELQKLWEKRLEESGFVDIEKSTGNLPKQRFEDPYKHARSDVVRETKQQYFMLLSQHLADERIENESERMIMELTADGFNKVEISKRLRELGLKKHNIDTIRYIRRRYENKWEIRKWNPEEMVSRKVKKPAIP